MSISKLLWKQQRFLIFVFLVSITKMSSFKWRFFNMCFFECYSLNPRIYSNLDHRWIKIIWHQIKEERSFFALGKTVQASKNQRMMHPDFRDFPLRGMEEHTDPRSSQWLTWGWWWTFLVHSWMLSDSFQFHNILSELTSMWLFFSKNPESLCHISTQKKDMDPRWSRCFNCLEKDAFWYQQKCCIVYIV